MHYFLASIDKKVVQVWLCQDDINNEEERIDAKCELFPLDCNPELTLEHMEKIQFKNLQKISREEFIDICNKYNLLVKNYKTSAGCCISS